MFTQFPLVLQTLQLFVQGVAQQRPSAQIPVPQSPGSVQV
jgi:hypothetical protein